MCMTGQEQRTLVNSSQSIFLLGLYNFLVQCLPHTFLLHKKHKKLFLKKGLGTVYEEISMCLCVCKYVYKVLVKMYNYVFENEKKRLEIILKICKCYSVS